MNVEEKTLEFIRDYAPKADRIARYVFIEHLRDLIREWGLEYAGRAPALSGQNSPAGECAANVFAAKEKGIQ